MEDLCEQTHTKYYELYRQNRLERLGFRDVNSDNKLVSFQQNFGTMRENLLATFQRDEDEMRQKFVLRVKEKENELKAIEKEVTNEPATPAKNIHQFKILFFMQFFRCLKSTPK